MIIKVMINYLQFELISNDRYIKTNITNILSNVDDRVYFINTIIK